MEKKRQPSVSKKYLINKVKENNMSLSADAKNKIDECMRKMIDVRVKRMSKIATSYKRKTINEETFVNVMR